MDNLHDGINLIMLVRNFFPPIIISHSYAPPSLCLKFVIVSAGEDTVPSEYLSDNVISWLSLYQLILEGVPTTVTRNVTDCVSFVIYSTFTATIGNATKMYIYKLFTYMLKKIQEIRICLKSLG